MDTFCEEQRKKNLYIYIEETGGGCDDKGPYVTYILFHKARENDGRGYWYSKTGKKFPYWWAHPREKMKVSEKTVSDEMLYAFYHGLHTINVYMDRGTKITAAEIIRRKEWVR